MKINLSKYNSFRIDIQSTINLNKELLSELKKCYPELSSKKKIEFIEFGTDYKISKKNYSARKLFKTNQ